MATQDDPVEITICGDGSLQVRTPGRYSMDLAVEILWFLDGQESVSVKNTGWRNGFGLDVAVGVPIRTLNATGELVTDGDQIDIRQTSGPIDDFAPLLDSVYDHLC